MQKTETKREIKECFLHSYLLRNKSINFEYKKDKNSVKRGCVYFPYSINILDFITASISGTPESVNASQ